MNDVKNIFSVISLLLMISCGGDAIDAEQNILQPDSEIIFRDSLGNEISKEELLKSDGTFSYEILGSENVPSNAKSLHDEARKYGQDGEYETAVEKLLAAHEQAPSWPYPVYDLAYTYLLMGDSDNALKYYRITDDLAPNGFFTSKTALHTLEKENSGEFESGLYITYLSLEWIDDSTEKAEMIQLINTTFPTFAPGWKEYSTLLEGEERLAAIEKGLALDCDVETKGMLLINKALVLNEDGQSEAAQNILMDIIFDDASTYGNVEMAKFVLSTFE